MEGASTKFSHEKLATGAQEIVKLKTSQEAREAS